MTSSPAAGLVPPICEASLKGLAGGCSIALALLLTDAGCRRLHAPGNIKNFCVSLIWRYQRQIKLFRMSSSFHSCGNVGCREMLVLDTQRVCVPLTLLLLRRTRGLYPSSCQHVLVAKTLSSSSLRGNAVFCRDTT